MKVGITYDLKEGAGNQLDLPDDYYEEFDSPGTIEAIACVLRGLGHEVVRLGDGQELLERLLADPPDFVFNFAEGQGVSRSREARVPAVLEMLGISYTGSDPLTCAVTLDKDCARRLVASEGVAVPGGVVLSPGQSANDALAAGIPFPAIVKPAWEGSSKGIRNKCLAATPADLTAAVESVRRDHRQPILVEEFIDGEELTVGMLGNDPPRLLGVMRVTPIEPVRHFVYSLEVKRDFRRQVRYDLPRYPSTVTATLEHSARTAFRVLGCRDVARIDFRLRDGVPYFLEVNPLPGLNPESSDLVILADLVGWSYRQLIEAIWSAGLQRMATKDTKGHEERQKK
jgi:D-alanine-D-alanine ligase